MSVKGAMLTSPRHWSIRWKLTFIAMIATTLALVLTILGFALFEYFTFRQHLVARLETMGQVIAGNSTAAIEFNRADDATATLATLAAQENIRAAGIYSDNGVILASYRARDLGHFEFPFHPRPDGDYLTAGSMDIYQPVQLDGHVIGTLFLRSDLRELYDRLQFYGFISLIMLVAASGAGLLLVNRLQRYVSLPIVSLAEISHRVSQEKNFALRAMKFGNDELGRLADAFNEMLDGIRQRDEQIQHHLADVQNSRDQLEVRVLDRTADLTRTNEELQSEMARRRESELKREQMQANLIEASRRAGMADVATGVLHNVGNVLNSVNVSTQLAYDAVKTSHVATFLKAADLLRQHAGDLGEFLTRDERGKTLPPFLIKLASAMQEEQAQLLKELEGLSSNVGHIREIVSMQQSLARVSGVHSRVTLGELVEDALKVNQAGLGRHGVKVVRDFEQGLSVSTDRHKILQILINLISNAKYAVGAVSDRERTLTISSRKIDGNAVCLAIADNGVGIDAHNMTRIFNYGFTTRKDGHGFGLHSSSLAARELGGTLDARSDGPGTGAVFELTLPIEVEVAAHAQ